MTLRQWVLVVACFSGALIYLGLILRQRFGPTNRALRWAARGDFGPALDWLNARIERKPNSPTLHGTLGQVYLMANRPQEAEVELRKALVLGTRNPSHQGALGWALVQLGRFDEALPVAEQANQRAHEDFEVYCLYCGLMAHSGRGREVVQLFDFLKRRSIQLQYLNPGAYKKALGAEFEFVRSMMNSAGLP
jgi:tetratricopeptide (TPR) repeat protein